MNSKMVLLFILFACSSPMIFCDEIIITILQSGTIKGTVIDADTKSPIFGANVLIIGTERGATTDMNGSFIIQNIPVGSYALQFTYVGYEQIKKTDIIIKSGKTLFIEIELKSTDLKINEVVVTSGYFSQKDDLSLSAAKFDYEEIRRAPGSMGDVSRIVMSLPSVAKIDDQANNLIVRGGSPIENGYYVDNIEIPNINHYPAQGSSGGPLGILNIDFIKNVNFSSGGFSSLYGDKLSSIMDITLREGDRDEFNTQLDLNFAGFGAIAEGPFFGNSGSWFIAARRSYLDLVLGFVGNSGLSVRYSDYQGKLVYDINQNNKLILVGVFGDDHSKSDKGQAKDNKQLFYGNDDNYENSGGFSWLAFWGKSGYSNTSISYTSIKYGNNYFESGEGINILKNNSFEQTINFRNVNHFRINKNNSLEFGFDAKKLNNEYDNFYDEYTNAFGESVSPLTVKKNINAYKFGCFINYIADPFSKLSITGGIRYGYFSYNNGSTIAPRFGITYKISDLTSINSSVGLYYQNLPLIILSQNENNKNLKDPSAVHYILGLNHLLSDDTKLTLEIYKKDYNDFPLDPSEPSMFVIDEFNYRYGFYFNHEKLVDVGKASSWGIETMIQKKLAKDIYGLISFSYFRTRYQDYNIIWRDRVFDNKIIFSAEGGYKPNNEWEFSARWMFAGGRPYTPFDAVASYSINRAVLDGNKINSDRYPDYHALNIRADKRFHFSNSNLVVYLSIWNAYNRQNVSTYFWNQFDNKQDVIYQWGILPIFGIEYEL